MRVVVDTGVLVSALIRSQGATGGVLRALRDGRLTIIYSTPILIEVIDVLGRSPFRAKYHIQPEDITDLVNLIRLRGELVTPQRQVSDCRDPKDNKFLEAALAGGAEAIVSGDDDLLILHPFEDIPIWRALIFRDVVQLSTNFQRSSSVRDFLEPESLLDSPRYWKRKPSSALLLP